MSGLSNVTINISSGNLGRQAPNVDNVAALVMCEYEGAAGIPVNTAKVVYSLKQAEDLGITPALDASLGILGHQHITDFFFKNPNGELYLWVTPTGTNWIDIISADEQNYSLAKLVIPANGRIKQIGIMAQDRIASHFVDVILGESIIEAAQDFADRMFDLKKPIDVIFLEGFGFNAGAGSATDLRAKACKNVAVVVGGDKTIASSDTDFNNYAAVGLVLGSSTGKQVHESLAWAKDSNTLTNAATSFFLEAKITSTAAADKYIGDAAAMDALNDKGYIFPRQFELRSGWYWNQSNNCNLDDDDFNRIETVQVIQKCLRLTYPILSQHVNETFNVTAAGRLTDNARRSIEAEIIQTLETNAINNISAIGDVIVDPVNDENNDPYPSILVDSTLRAIVGIRPKGKAEQIILTIGFQA